MDKLIVKDIHLPCRIGCSEEERKREQTILVDLEFELDTSLSAKSEKLSDTIDYAPMTEFLQEITAESKFLLIETLAEVIAERILKTYSIDNVRVRVSKPNPPTEVKVASAAVEIYRTCNSGLQA